MKSLLIILVIVVALGGAFFVWHKISGPGLIKEPLPSAQVYQPSPTPKNIPKVSFSPAPTVILNTSSAISSQINLAVPFTSQAPNGNWDAIHEEFCEEASVLMAISYVNGWPISSPDMADQKMFEIKAFEENRFGYYKDTTAEETATILREFYKYDKVKVVYDPTVESIKMALAESRVIIIPAAGQELGNPYFTPPGPLYHMLVIKGYTKAGNFITNDPGTRHGADYIYNPGVIMNAIHDWNGGNVLNGKKVMIVVG